MCVDGSTAPLSRRYLNSQLSALWRNAQECVEWAAKHHGGQHSVNFASTDHVQHKHQRAFAQFHYAGAQESRVSVQHEDLFFTAAFSEPRLEFICNHEAALYIKIDKGHLNKAWEKSKSTHTRLIPEDNVPIDGLEVTFRVKFSHSVLEGSDPRIARGNGYQVQLLILDFDAAKIARFNQSIGSDAKVALEFYLHQYLAQLTAAGYNYLINLPELKRGNLLDSSDDAYQFKIDYSLTTKAIEEKLSVDVFVQGTSVASINTHLRNTWLDIAAFDELPTDKISVCLAELKTEWLQYTESHYHVRFGPPTIEALCDQEVVVYYNVEELKIYESADFSILLETLREFSIAFVANVIKEKSESGTDVLVLDLENARYCSHLSNISSLSQEVRDEYLSSFVKFVERTYLDILVEYDLAVIFVNEPSYVPPSPTSDTSIEELPVIAPGHDILCGFDQIFTVTEESVNIIFKTLWATAKRSALTDVLYKWSVEERFNATFEEPRLQLLTNSRAVIWFTFASGTLHIEGHPDTNVTGWRLAFEVNLKQVKHSELRVEESWSERFTEALFGQVEQESSTVVEHVVLDFETAFYVHELSSFEGVFNNGATAAVLKIKAIKEHMRAYIKAFAFAGYHVLHSTPVYAGTTQARTTATTFQVVSKTTITVKNVVHKHEAAIIVVCGVTHGRALPKNVLIKWNAILVSKSMNTVCIGRMVFLEYLLRQFALVNQRTTIVPRYPKGEEEDWCVYLTTWANHMHRQRSGCGWKPDNKPELPDTLEFKWEHGEGNSYVRYGTFQEDKSYNVDCKTVNRLSIPTTFRRGGMDIHVNGETEIRLAGEDDKQKWSKRCTATWHAIVHVTSDRDGMHVSLAPVTPSIGKYDEVGHAGAFDFNVRKLLEDEMPKTVTMDEVLAELRVTLEGTYKHASAGVCKYAMYSPMFNTNGDLLLQVRPHDPNAKPSSSMSSKGMDRPVSPPPGAPRSSSRARNPMRGPPANAKRSESWFRRKSDIVTGESGQDVPRPGRHEMRTSVLRYETQEPGTSVFEMPPTTVRTQTQHITNHMSLGGTEVFGGLSGNRSGSTTPSIIVSGNRSPLLSPGNTQ